MLYHIDNTPEMPSDRFGTGGKQQFTDPVDHTDRAYINYGIQKGIEICYGKWREVYGCPDKYYSGTDNRMFGDWLVAIYTNSKTSFDLYREKNPKNKNLIIKIGMTYYKCEETRISSESEVDMVRYSGLPLGFFLGSVISFIIVSILFYVI